MTQITKSGDGWTTIRCGELTIIVPTDPDGDCADVRAEIRCNGSRVFVEAHDDGPLVSAIEYYKELVHR